MKKRLRKKKRVIEFQDFGFGSGFRFSDLLTMAARNNFLNRFIEEAIEKNGLQYGGGGVGIEWNGFVTLELPLSKTPYPIDELLIKKLLEPKLIWCEIWSQDLFGLGDCTMGHAYSNKALNSVENIDKIFAEPCGPEQKKLYRQIQEEWYLYYISSN